MAIDRGMNNINNTTKKSCYVESGKLYDYRTGEYLREATTEEAAESERAAERDGGRGVIEVNGL